MASGTHEPPSLSRRGAVHLGDLWWVGAGPKYDPDSTYPVPAGSLVIDRPKEIHYDGAKEGDCLLYIVGMGPSTTVQAEAK